MSEMVERVAQALIAHFEIRPETNITVLAQVAISVMHRPSGAMLIAARRYAGDNHFAEWDNSAGRHPNDIPFYEGIWQAMIDAALKE